MYLYTLSSESVELLNACTGLKTLPCKSHVPPRVRSNMESSQLSCGEKKNAADFSILIGNVRLSRTHAQCLLRRYGLLFRLESACNRHLENCDIWILIQILLQIGTPRLKHTFWIMFFYFYFLIKKDYGGNCLGNNCSRPCEIALSRG